MKLTIPVIEYLGAIGIGLLLWILGRYTSAKIARFGDLVEQVMSRRGNRIAVLIIWWWLGWHFFTM